MAVAKKTRSLNMQAKLLLGTYGDTGTIHPARLEVLKASAAHPWNFLTARDPLNDDRPFIWTRDESDSVEPVKPFPADQEYIFHYVDVLFRERLVVVQKCRQMYITTATLLYILWESLFIEARRWLVSKIIEEDAKELIRDKVRFPYGQLPGWFKELYPASDKPEARIDCKGSGSYILAVAENVANREARGGTASGIFVDESAFQREYPKIWASSMPMAAKLIAVSTPEVGNPGARYMRDQVFDNFDHAI